MMGRVSKATCTRKHFKMFQTLQPRDVVEGSGMGLSLAKKLVESEGGQIWIQDNQPRGAKICFTWPTTVQQDATEPNG